MNILLIGGGGRENALVWKLKQSKLCTSVFISPGNAGTHALGENVSLDLGNLDEIRSFCLNNTIKMVVVGPEAPLVDGIFDRFKADAVLKDLLFIGPSKEAAKLEGSKAYAKEFMIEFDIPTAKYGTFSLETLDKGKEFLSTMTPPYVLKADGLAAGKGVLILDSLEEAQASLAEMLHGKFGAASNEVVIEEFLKGLEFSVFALTDGKNYVILPEAKDYKRIGEGDTGLNTGGMGAISPVPFVDQKMWDKVIRRIIEPTITGINTRQMEYQGFVFFGLIEQDGEPYVIEYNCRLGDPETEVILPRLKNDLVELFTKCANKELDQCTIALDPQTAATVMLVSGGYPEAYQKGKAIQLAKSGDSILFHAGTKIQDGQLLTNGGRVLAITSLGDSIEEATSKSFDLAKKVAFEGKYYRKDIGKDLLS